MRFIVMLKGNEETESGELPGDDVVEAMTRYNEELVKAGVLLAAEGLYPSSKGALVAFSGGKTTVTDGPFTKAKELVAGFWLIQTKSRDEAIEWVRRAPLDGGTTVELREVFEADDFAQHLSRELREKQRQLGERMLENQKR